MARNAFAIRTSEQSASDDVFARYFAPEVLTVLPSDLFATSALVIRSSPGGGKTSLLRMFTPGPMLQVHRNPRISPHDDIHRQLHALGALDGTEIKVMGILVPCTSGYSEIPPPTPDTSARGLFRALVNARVVLRALRALCVLQNLEYSAGLSRVEISCEPSLFDEGPVPRRVSALDLRGWAEDLETRCFMQLDALTSRSGSDFPAHTSFDAIVWLSQASFYIDGRRSPARPIVMFDDAHRLRPGQRKMLYDELLDHRSGTPVWLAERTEVLDPADFLTTAVPSRDYIEIQLERAWADANKGRRFFNFVTTIADRRVMREDLQSFGDHLASLEEGSVDERLRDALNKLRAQAQSAVVGTNRYDKWLQAEIGAGTRSLFEAAIAWAKVNILIARDRNKAQQSLDLEPLSDQELEARDTSGLPGAAEKFVCRDYDLPYYYGIDRVVRLSSFNVEEFLQICAALYEHLHAARVLRTPGPVTVSAADQDQAIRKLAEKRYREIARAFPLGAKAQSLIGAVCRLCQDRTFVPNAPYAPGVTGIALSAQDREVLRAAAKAGSKHPFNELASVISACVAQNLFEVRDQLRQDNKEWLVLYLNRMLCVRFDLVYQTGGWQKVALDRLHDWSQGLYSRSESLALI
jgi:hypothetical protein